MHNVTPRIAFLIVVAVLSRLFDNAKGICQHIIRQVALINEPEIVESKARMRCLQAEWERLNAVLPSMPGLMTWDLWYYTIVALVLAFGGLSAAHLAIAPFGFGFHVWPFSVGLAIVCIVFTDFAMDRVSNIRLMKIIISAGLIASISGLVILAIVRADIVMVYAKQALAELTTGDGSRGQIDPTAAVAFYEASKWKVQWFFILLAASTELGAGLCWHQARLLRASNGLYESARRRLDEIEKEMIVLTRRIIELQNEPLIFEEQFWTEFRRGLLYGPEERGGMSLRPLVLALMFGFLLVWAAKGENLRVVVAPDFTRSEAAAIYDNSTNHQADINATVTFISQLPCGAHFSVIGITGSSFSRPLILLSGQINCEPSVLTFVDRERLLRAKYATDLRRRLESIQLADQVTDVFGAVILGSEMFSRSDPTARNVFVFIGDMRHSLPPVNIEQPKVVDVGATMKAVERLGLVADLKNVEVLVYGVHAAGKDVQYWRRLHEFWSAYFNKCGARLEAFSMLRDIPRLAPPTKRQ